MYKLCGWVILCYSWIHGGIADGKIKDLEERIDKLPTIEMVQKIVMEILEKCIPNQDSREEYDSKIICSEKEVICLSNQGYDCQMIGSGKWLMRKKLLGQMPS